MRASTRHRSARAYVTSAATLAVLTCGAPFAGADSAESEDARRVCTTYGRPTSVGKVPDALEELSGLAASRRHDGLYWAHNDSGNAFELFGIEASGHIRARFPLRGAESRDIEDIAVGPCEDGSTESCVFLGDIGDNLHRRPEGRIYRVPEPATLEHRTLDVEVLRFRWPTEPENGEAMVVDPKTGVIFVWSKEPRSLGVVHRLEGLRKDGTGRAVAIKQIHSPKGTAGLPTGADTHPDGDRILIRTYSQAWELRREGATGVEDILEATPVQVPARTQRQSEAVSYTHDGLGYVLGTEGAGGPIYAIGCDDEALGSSRSSS